MEEYIKKLNKKLPTIKDEELKELIQKLIGERQNLSDSAKIDELTGLYNKTYNANANQNKSIIISYKSDQMEALKECLNDFKSTHSSVIADNLFGFQKSIFTCENCKNVSYYFNSFEYLIFDLEIISKHLNLNNNNNIITFSFDECFQYLFKEE